ncbi:hypothetical protein Tco_0015603 [Tanacetum coccineum]
MVITDEMIDYGLAKYENKWQVDDTIADVILDYLMQKALNEGKRIVKDDKGKGIVKDDKGKRTVKNDKGKLTGIEYVENLEKMIRNVEEFLYKAKEQMIMKKAVETSSNDTETSSGDTETNFDDTRENMVGIQKVNSKSTSISKSEMCEWYLSTSSDEDSTSNEDSSYDDHMAVYKAKKPPSSKHLTAKTCLSSKTYQAKLRSSSKDLQADVGASAWSKTLLVPTKKPPPVRNRILGLATALGL